MHNQFIWIYLGVINLISAILFASDKRAAIARRRRIPERTLHFFEMLGGAFATILLMYALRHKNRKFSYWAWTWLISLSWALLVFFIVTS